MKNDTGGEQGKVPGEGKSIMKKIRPILFLVVILSLLVIAKVFGLGEKLGDLRDWIGTLGSLGSLVFIALYIVAVVGAIPGSALTVAAGALFGSVFGVIWVSIASTVGASLAFLIARYFARDAIVRWLSENEKFRRLDQLTEDHGAIIVALTRLVPIFPFNLLNYGFGLTRVRFWTYVFWSWLCMLPGTVLYVVGADAVTKGLTRGEVPWVLIGALAGIGLLLFFIIRFARKKLQEKEGTSGTGTEPGREKQP
jgi:uncharacterized membrane protein YdjX (TVP38/TMEM64 family)